jgi:hypothetical protein
MEGLALHSLLERGYSIVGISISMDETASAFEREVEAIIRFAESAQTGKALSGMETRNG